MAGAGYKLFNTGDVLTAAQVNTYLQEQTVMVFANSTARTTALSGVLAEGMMSYLQDTNAVEVYNGSAWVGVSGSGDVTEVQAGTGISVASGTGPIPVVTNTMATAIDAKGDLLAGTGADTFSRLAVGSNGTVLTADSAEATGLKWTTVAGGTSGLTLISATTIGSGVSSVTVSSAFSATYDNYLIVIAFDTASSNSSTNLELGSGGNVYIGNAIYMQGTSGTVNGINYNTTTSMFVGYNATDGGGSIIQLINPNKAKKTLINAIGGAFHTSTANNLMSAVYYANETTQYTSFKISPSTGTYTGGSIRTYGYQNS